MFKRVIFSVILCLFFCNLFAQETGKNTQVQNNDTTQTSENETISAYTNGDIRHLFVALTEIQMYNIGLYFYDDVILDTEYANITLDTMLANLKSGWIWDQDEFYINQILHPYQGMLYYTAGRSNGFGVFESLGINFFGMLCWEYLMEIDVPAINDLFITTIDGFYFGEIFHRTYKLTENFDPFLAFLISPQEAITYFFTGQRSPKVSGRLEELSFKSGYGFISSDVHKEYHPENLSMSNFKSMANGGLFYVYNDPYGHTTKEILDQYFVRLHYLWNPSYTMFFVQSDGMLYSKALNLEPDTTLGFSFHYDYIANEDITYNFNGFGGTFRQRYEFNEDNIIKWGTALSFAFNGCSEYYDIHINDICHDSVDGSKQRLYDIGIGPSFDFEFEYYNKMAGTFFINGCLNYIWTLPAAKMTDGDTGANIVFFGEAGYEHKIWENFSLGVSDFLYFKKGCYDNTEDVYHFMSIANLYLKYTL